MNITQLIAAHLREVYEGENWTEVCIAEIVSSVNWQQAQQLTPGSPNTIASLLHHLCYWNGIMEKRLLGQNPVVPETNGFDMEVLSSEADWQALQAKARTSFQQLADAVAHFPEEKLANTYATGKASYYKNLQGTVEHAHYHLGQMVIIRKLLAA